MMDYDFFDLAGLPFDPPEKAVKRVKTAIDKVEKELKEVLGITTQQLERNDINAKLSFLKTASAAILGNDDKLTSAYEELANARTKQEIGNLAAAASVLKQSGFRVITNGTIRVHRQKTKLSKEHVEEVFRASGFTISEIDPLKAMPKFPTNADKTYAELEALRKSKDPNPNGADLTLATDLYAFAAYLTGEPENAAVYRGKSTSELAALLDGFAKKFATRNDDLGKLCASLATAGKSYVFNSEENRQAYEAYLKYKAPALIRLFESISRVSKSDLLDARFAEECIKQISAVFGNYEVALAIYNKEAGIKDDPYLPEKAVFYVKCHYCQSLVEFDGIAEAQKVNKCTFCGKPLYKQCKKCSISVLTSLDKCPECGFVFASAANFERYFADAEQAYRKSDFESARKCLSQAQLADPSEKRRTDELASRISAGEKQYEKPINDLRKLIADKMYQKASISVANIIGKFPGLNVSDFERKIDSSLSQARTAFANAKNLSPSKKADECLNILRECADFEPAIDVLRTTPLEACKSFNVAIDNSTGCANISWSRSSEHGVKYRLIRKQGKEMPANEKDGETLIDETAETSYCDRDILSDWWYSYAVFYSRYGVFSSAAGKTIRMMADVSDTHIEQTGKTIRLTWNQPRNCVGVTVHRIWNGVETALTNKANGSFEDADVQEGAAYTYILYTNYSSTTSSAGVTLPSVIFIPMIDSFTITTKQLKENTCKVTWSFNRKGIDLRVLVNGKRVREIKSDAGSCDLTLPVDDLYTIAVEAFSGGSWLKSVNCEQVNTFTPCSIDKAASHFQESAIAGQNEPKYCIELHLKIGGTIPANAVGFYYAIRTGDAQNRWPTAGDIGKAADIYRIGISSYRENGEILYTETAREESAYYVSLFTIYNAGGKEIVSNPKPCRFDRPLTADVFWKVSKSLLGGLKLLMEVSGNRPMARIPEIVLCACADNQHLLSYSDPKATKIMTVPVIILESPQKVYSNSYDIKTNLTAKQLKGMKFFCFESATTTNEVYFIRWAKGFRGKA